MSNPSETLLSPTELHDQLTSGFENLSDADAHELFSERLEEFLEDNNIEESDIISGQSEYASTLSEAAFNGMDFSGLEGTGLSLADAHRMMNDDGHRLEMAEKYLTGNEETRIENEYSELVLNPSSPFIPPSFELTDPDAIELRDEATRTKEFMHYELRDALNSGAEGLPAALEDFKESEDYDEWKQMLGDQAAFHQNGGAEDLKFIHPDGREVVYDGDTKELLTEDRYMGTYNYVNATTPNDTTPGIVESVQNTQTDGSSLHKIYDVDTWVEMGNTRADRYENGGEIGRQAQLIGSVVTGGVNSLGNDVDDAQNWVSNKIDQAGEVLSDAGDAIADKASEAYEAASDVAEQVGEVVSEKAEQISEAVSNTIDQAGEALSDAGDAIAGKAGEAYEAASNTAEQVGEAISDTIEGLKSFGSGLWREEALNSDPQNLNGEHIQHASLSETAMPADTGTVYLEDAIGMLAEDHKILNASATGQQSSSIQDALNHPDAAQMFQNLHTHGVATLAAEVTPDMSAEDRVRELLLAGQQATQDAGIPMPSEQREFEAMQEQGHRYEDDHSYSL